MRRVRVVLSGEVSSGDVRPLSARDSHHVERVLRRRVGDVVEILTRGGLRYAGTIVHLTGGANPRGGEACDLVMVRVGEVLGGDEPLALIRAVDIGLAVVKGNSFELALKMASELGVRRVVPLLTARTVVRRAGGRSKLERWTRILEESAKQCGREPMGLAEEVSLTEWLQEFDPARSQGWICTPGGPTTADLSWDDTARTFLIGPEGGFSEAETEAAMDCGCRVCSFPLPILRTPTAVALVAALQLVRRQPERPDPG